jgi:hypothetical protein
LKKFISQGLWAIGLLIMSHCCTFQFVGIWQYSQIAILSQAGRLFLSITATIV